MDEMGISNQVCSDMLQIPSQGVKFVDRSYAESHGLVGIAPLEEWDRANSYSPLEEWDRANSYSPREESGRAKGYLLREGWDRDKRHSPH